MNTGDYFDMLNKMAARQKSMRDEEQRKKQSDTLGS